MKKPQDEVDVLGQVEEIGEQLDISTSGTRKGEDSYLKKERNGQ